MGQLPIQRSIQNLAAGPEIIRACHPVSHFRGQQIRQLPAKSLSKVAWGKVVRIVPVGNHGLVGLPLRREMVVHANEDHLLEAHVECQLKSNIGNGSAFPQAPGGIPRESGALVCGVHERG